MNADIIKAPIFIILSLTSKVIEGNFYVYFSELLHLQAEAWWLCLYQHSIKESQSLIYILTQIQFCMPEIFKVNVLNRFLITKSPFKLMPLCSEFIKVIFQSKSWCEPGRIQNCAWGLGEGFLCIHSSFVCNYFSSLSNHHSQLKALLNSF